MGKSQYPHQATTASSNYSSSAMDVEPHTPKWKDVCPTYKSSFLSACHDKVHLQEQPLIGSPPPKSQTPGYWEDPEAYLNPRLEIPTFIGDHQNNNKHNGQNHHGPESDKERGDLMELSKNVEGLRLQPIIICEYVDDANDQDTAVGMGESGEEILTLSVPTVDVRNEKKRPPLSEFNV